MAGTIIFVLYKWNSTWYFLSMAAKKEAEYRQELLEAWEETYKKGQLTFWLFLALKEGEKYTDEIRAFITDNTKGTLSCEEQSLYRTLRKYRELGMVDFRTGPGMGGPERKYYFLTPLGVDLLGRFVERNINLFYDSHIQQLIKKP
jgi:PadR family transcriptional regulator, regulatory protein PadR